MRSGHEEFKGQATSEPGAAVGTGMSHTLRASWKLKQAAGNPRGRLCCTGVWSCNWSSWRLWGIWGQAMELVWAEILVCKSVSRPFSVILSCCRSVHWEQVPTVPCFSLTTHFLLVSCTEAVQSALSSSGVLPVGVNSACLWELVSSGSSYTATLDWKPQS